MLQHIVDILGNLYAIIAQIINTVYIRCHIGSPCHTGKIALHLVIDCRSGDVCTLCMQQLHRLQTFPDYRNLDIGVLSQHLLNFMGFHNHILSFRTYDLYMQIAVRTDKFTNFLQYIVWISSCFFQDCRIACNSRNRKILVSLFDFLNVCVVN